MRALVMRLAASGITVLLSSHDMAEVEDICDNVTIMKTGSVVYHGTIATLREQAPPAAHRLTTSDDRRAFGISRGHDQLSVSQRTDDALAVRGDQQHVDAYVVALAADGIAVRSLTLEETPLETLFFMLTETSPADVSDDLDERTYA